MNRPANTSHAVRSQRFESLDSQDDFPTPPWATRALVEHVIGETASLKTLSCLEPACGAGYMARPLGEYFGRVQSSDIADYGYGLVSDFLTSPPKSSSFDWVITNPPFRRAEDFVTQALDVARQGVAILARTVLLEGKGRYRRLFKHEPPAMAAQFVERVPIIKGRVDPKATTATSYVWLVWRRGATGAPRLLWIPPCRKQFERPRDYTALLEAAA